MKLSIIIVNYQSKKHLLYCLASINRFLYRNDKLQNDFEVILVNNDKKTLSNIPEYPFLSPKIIEVGKNVGFGTGANLGVIMAQGEYILFLNPDTLFSDNSLGKVLDYLQKNSQVGALGLSIINKTRHQPENWSCGKTTTWGSILFRNTINKPWNKKTPQKVEWSSGAGLIISKKAFRQVKGFAKEFFMYFEDQDLCLRLAKENYQIIHYPQAKILHLNGKSWRNKQEQKKYYRQSQLIFFKKHNTFIGYLILKTIYKIKNLF